MSTPIAPRELCPGPDIAPALRARDVGVFDACVPLPHALMLDACDPHRRLWRSTGTLRPLPASLPSAGRDGITVLLASCTYRWPPYFRSIAAHLDRFPVLGQVPSFALYVGDNVYLDVPPPRLQDAAAVVDRYLDYYLDDGYAALRAQLPSFATFDDHELWNDFPERSVPFSCGSPKTRRPTSHERHDNVSICFSARSIPPRFPAPSMPSASTCRPLSSFVVDTRTDRGAADAPSGRLMPEADLAALEAGARTLEGPGVLVIGQPLWIEPVSHAGPFRGDHNVSHFAAHYARICDALERAPFDVLVLRGDVHYSRLLRIHTRTRRVVHEVTASTLVSIPSLLGSIGHAVGLGAGEPQHSHDLEDTTRPPRAGWSAAYRMGTGCGTCYGLVHFRAAATHRRLPRRPDPCSRRRRILSGTRCVSPCGDGWQPGAPS